MANRFATFWTPLACLGVSTVIALAWSLGWVCEGGGWDGLILFVAGGMASAATTVLLYNRLIRQHAAARRFVELLRQMDETELASENILDQLPRLDSDSPWRAGLHGILERLTSCAARLVEAEHLRGACEIRARRATAQLERVSSILASLPEPVIAVDAYDELLFANASAEKLFGFCAESAERRALASFLQCEKLANLLADTTRRRLPASRMEELEIERAQGDSRWYSVTVNTLGGPDSSEAGHGAVAVLRDIGAQKEIQQRNAEFVSAVSHEMKTPLAGIKAYVELLVDGDAEDDATREEFLAVINSQADRLQRLIDNLLNLARIEAGVVKVSKEPQSLNAILEEAFNVMHPAAESKGVTLVKELSPMYLGVLADHDLLLQAAINLLSNAVKYTPRGGTVRLRSRMSADEVAFEVEDTGVGLSPEDCRRIFEKFYRVEKDKKMAAGTGLGLPLAKHIVEDVHGGTLAVTSQLGSGSTFAITLNAGAFTN